jgi:hypothetical protein
MTINQDVFCLPPFWGAPRDSDLTVALISAQRLERQAESRLIRRRLKRIMIEQELYNHMEGHMSRRLHKADSDAGITHGVLRVSGLTPAGKRFGDMVGSGMSDESDSEVSS